MNFQVQQTQFAAGHGGFHVGRIAASPGRNFAWSYDCGTWGAVGVVNREVAEAVTRLSATGTSLPLNVCYLSHFHEDHVKGLPELASSLAIRHVVAPLIEPWERLVQVLDHPDPSDFALRLAADPGATLTEVADTVILVRPAGDGLEAPPDGPIPADGDDRAMTPTFVPGTHEESSVGATFKMWMGGSPIWILAPFLPTGLEQGRPEFLDELRSLWGVKDSAAVEELLADPDEFLERCGSVAKRKKLRAAYSKALKAAGLEGNQNWTSLLLYSGPYGTRRRWRSRWADSTPTATDPREGSPWGSHAGWLHTGDAYLGDASVWKEVEGHYGAWLEALGTFQAPHHGAVKNWSSELVQCASQGANVVVPGVPGFRKWPLPAYELQRDVAASGCALVQVTDDPGSRFSDTWTIAST